MVKQKNKSKKNVASSSKKTKTKKSKKSSKKSSIQKSKSKTREGSTSPLYYFLEARENSLPPGGLLSLANQEHINYIRSVINTNNQGIPYDSYDSPGEEAIVIDNRNVLPLLQPVYNNNSNIYLERDDLGRFVRPITPPINETYNKIDINTSPSIKRGGKKNKTRRRK